MTLARVGPLVFWLLMFVAGAVIRVVAFNIAGVWLDVPADACLWAVGVILSLTVSERATPGARLASRTAPLAGGGPGYTITYEPQLTGDPRPSEGSVYLLVTSMVAWIITLVLSENAIRLHASRDPAAFYYIGVAYAIGGAAVVAAVLGLLKATPPALVGITGGLTSTTQGGSTLTSGS